MPGFKDREFSSWPFTTLDVNGNPGYGSYLDGLVQNAQPAVLPSFGADRVMGMPFSNTGAPMGINKTFTLECD